MSARRRVIALVAVAAVAAAAGAAAIAWVGRGPTESGEAASPAAPGSFRDGFPPLALDPFLEDEAEAQALLDAEELYETGRRPEALRRFERILGDDPDSLEAAVGAALARWPDGTLAALRELAGGHPESGLVQLHVGFALFWQRNTAAATAAWRKVEQVEPDSPAAIRAENVLHPDMPQGRPIFVPTGRLPAEIATLSPVRQLTELERLAEQSDEAEDWIVYGVALQRAGRPVSARAAYERGVAVDPTSVEAKAAAALVRFDKDDPAQAFSRLGPLSRDYPKAAVVRFHLGLSLLWLAEVGEARRQLTLARDEDEDGIYGREAADLLERLAEVG